MSLDPTTSAVPPAQTAPGAPAPTPPAGGPAPQRPDGVSEAEWAALGDPGKAAIVRERERATTAERQLAEARRQQTPAAPTPQPPPAAQPTAPAQHPQPGQPQDTQSQIAAAVQAALQPFVAAQQQRDATEAAGRIRDAVSAAAAERFHDVGDALAHLDLTQVTDGAGGVDAAKVAAALDTLLTAKPYLGKPLDPRRRVAAGVPLGATGATPVSLEDRTKSVLAQMQASAGIKLAGS